MKMGLIALMVGSVLPSCGVMRLIKTPPPASPHQPPVTKVAEKTVRIQVYSHGWHAGLVLPVETLRRQAWTKDLRLTGTKHVELGWGSEEFYRTKGLNAPMLIRGLFWPTAAVMHVERFDESPYRHYPYSQLETFDLTEDEADRLVTLLGETFARKKDDRGNLRLIDLGHGLKVDSTYYQSKPKYFYPQTCNVWTANLLRAGGVHVKKTTRSPKLMRELRKSPRLVR